MRQFLWALLMTAIFACPVRAVDHGNFMQGTYPDGPSVTRDCLKCHGEAGKDFIETAHWRWKGPSPHVAGLPDDIELGKRNLMNNF